MNYNVFWNWNNTCECDASEYFILAIKSDILAPKNTNDIIKAFNIVLREFMEEHNTLQRLHTRIYYAAIGTMISQSVSQLSKRLK